MIKPDFKNFTKKQECLFGAMLGDILGAGFEFKPPSQINTKLITNPLLFTERTHCYPNFIGQYTDDFSQTLCVEECLNNFNLDFDNQLVLWSRGKYWAKDVLFDMGTQTSKGIEYFRRHDSLLSQPNGSGNGALMRIAPLAFDFRLSKDFVERYCEITHNNQECIDTAMFYTYLLATIKDDIRHHCLESSFDTYWRYAQECFKLDMSKSNQLGNGYVYDTLASIKHCMDNSTNTVEAITEAIKLGYDTDTTASCVGAVAALYYGLGDIPDEWLKYIQPSLENHYVQKLFGMK